jgi:CRISPR/Cas system CSM-associated protein Csm4 (group 5 of RAMP superfamily)
MKTIKLTQRSGFNRTYTSDKGEIEIVVCNDANLYATTGYYLRLSRAYPNHIASKAYSSGKQAAIAAYKSI